MKTFNNRHGRREVQPTAAQEDVLREETMEEPPKVESQSKGTEPRSTSERKREANRKNALRSTGPKTPRGKSLSRLNSLRHGLLARAVPVRNLIAFGMSEAKEFDCVLRDIYVELQPVGKIEEILVERIAYCHYQMARIARYHAALITLAAYNEDRKPTRQGFSERWEDLIEFRIPIQRARIALQESGFLGTALLAELKSVLPGSDRLITIEKLNTLLVRSIQRENAMSDSEAQFWKKEILQILDDEERDELASLRAVEKLSKERWNAQVFQHLFPDSAGMEKILRYESQYETGFYRALAKLEHLQRQRPGDEAPQFPKLTM